mmetsp:Transcript_11961/g.22174  ORF Transcript_11961/g.22174 Transcript_11961/m.22174 type:complete len:419 (+) Transcript_11961:67-1323(+)
MHFGFRLTYYHVSLSLCLFVLLAPEDLFFNLVHLGQTRVRIQIFQGIKDTYGLAVSSFTFYGNLGICCPFHDFLFGRSLGNHCLAKGILFNVLTEPIVSFDHGFERRGRCMHPIQTRIGFGGETQFLVLVQNGSSDGTDRSGGRVGGTQHLATEILPAQGIGRPRNSVPLDLFTGIAVFSSHVHVKSIHDVNILDFATVETTTKFDQVFATTQFRPFRVDSCTIETKFGRTIHGIVDLSSFNGVIPTFTKHLFESSLSLVGNIQILGLQFDRLAGNGTVMSINVLIFVDLFGSHFTLIGNTNPGCLELSFQDRLDLAGSSLARVRFDKHKGRVGFAGKIDLQLVDCLFERLRCLFERLCFFRRLVIDISSRTQSSDGDQIGAPTASSAGRKGAGSNLGKSLIGKRTSKHGGYDCFIYA